MMCEKHFKTIFYKITKIVSTKKLVAKTKAFLQGIVCICCINFFFYCHILFSPSFRNLNLFTSPKFVFQIELILIKNGFVRQKSRLSFLFIGIKRIMNPKAEIFLLLKVIVGGIYEKNCAKRCRPHVMDSLTCGNIRFSAF